MPGSESGIALRHVALSLGGSAIYDDLSFDVHESEFLCLLGPSGCGKSTALRLIGDLLPLQSGVVSIGGHPPAARWDRIAYVFQSPRLLPWKDALDNAAFGIEMRSPEIGREERRARAARQLLRLGLGDDLHKMPGVLSGGERQRVAIARALALDPDIILMDEPFSALDPKTRRRLRTQIVDLWRDSGKTVVFVTHDIEEALVLANRILVLSPKPAKVIAIETVTAAHPRDVDHHAGLRDQRARLQALFETLGEPLNQDFTDKDSAP